MAESASGRPGDPSGLASPFQKTGMATDAPEQMARPDDRPPVDDLPPETMEAKLDRLKRNIKERDLNRAVQLPMWPDPERGIPNELIRSALFAAIHGKNRQQMKATRIAAQGKYTIEFTGVQLTQVHLDVFEGVMHIARGTHEGNKVCFTGHQLLKLIGHNTGGRDHQWLYGALQELTATSVSISRGDDIVFWGSLLPRGAGAGKISRRQYVVEISKDLIALFNRGFSRIEWEQRRALKKKPLACWLQMYFSSHAKPFPVSVSFLYEQSGGVNKNLWSFRQNVRLALEEIREAGVIVSWTITKDDLVVVQRPGADQRLPAVGSNAIDRRTAPQSRSP